MTRRQNFGMNNFNSSFNSRINQLNRLSMQNKIARENNVNTIRRQTLGLQSAREAALAEIGNEIDPNNGITVQTRRKKAEWTESQKAYFKSIIDDIIEAERERNRIDEWVLIKKFLVLFYKIVTGKELFKELKPNYTLLLQKWFAISLSPYKGVDVVDTTGRVIYTTPPLFINIDQLKEFQNDAALKKIEKVQEMNNWIQGVGDRQFDKYITQKHVSKASAKDREEYVRQWMDVFRRYFLLKDQNDDENEQSANNDSNVNDTVKTEPIKSQVEKVNQPDDDLDFF